MSLGGVRPKPLERGTLSGQPRGELWVQLWGVHSLAALKQSTATTASAVAGVLDQ